MEDFSPPNRWYEPPNEHETDICYGCHSSGGHKAPDLWAEEGCDLCAEKLSDYCSIHKTWYCDEHRDGFCHEHGYINGGEDCTNHYLEA